MNYHSQNNQDYFLDNQVFKGLTGGIFIDIGAHDGKTFSNTYFFEKFRDWKGICIEPLPDRFKDLEKNRNCIKVNACIAERNETGKFLKIEGPSEMLSGLVSEYHPNHLQRIDKSLKLSGGTRMEIDVACININDLLAEHNLFSIDYCSIDTEGNELTILRSIDFNKFKIKTISVENNFNAEEILDFMKSNHYVLLARLGSDDIYIKMPENLSFLQRLSFLKTELNHRIKGMVKKLIYLRKKTKLI